MTSKYKELLDSLSQYKAEINRKLTNAGNPYLIGYQCKKGIGYRIHFVDYESRVLHSFFIANNPKELLLAIQLMHNTLNSLGKFKVL